MNALGMLAYFGQYLWVGSTIHREQRSRRAGARCPQVAFAAPSWRTNVNNDDDDDDDGDAPFGPPEAFICERNSESDRFAILQPTKRFHRPAFHESHRNFTYRHCHFVADAIGLLHLVLGSLYRDKRQFRCGCFIASNNKTCEFYVFFFYNSARL